MWLPCATSNGVLHGAGPCCCTVPYSLLMWLRPAALAVHWLPAGMLACRLRCTPHQPGPAVHLQQDHLHQHHQEPRQPGVHAQYRWRPCPAQQLGRAWYHRCMKALQLEAPAEHKCRRCSQLVEGVQLCMAPAPLGAIPMQAGPRVGRHCAGHKHGASSHVECTFGCIGRPVTCTWSVSGLSGAKVGTYSPAQDWLSATVC
jgi:hypothetical protein